jgi:hypothetical protein
MLLQGKKETQTHDQAYGTYGPICTPVALSSASFPPAQALSPEESRPREARPEDSSLYITWVPGAGAFVPFRPRMGVSPPPWPFQNKVEKPMLKQARHETLHGRQHDLQINTNHEKVSSRRGAVSTCLQGVKIGALEPSKTIVFH